MKRVVRAFAWFLILICLVSAAGAERLDDSVLYTFYNNSAFFGDSITRSLATRVADLRQKDDLFMNKTSFFATGSITLGEGRRPVVSGDDVTHCFNYRGTDATMYYITSVIGAKKVFILLGMNDPIGTMIEKGLEWVEEIMYWMRRDQRTCDVEVYFFSITPVGTAWCIERNRPDYQAALDEYNARLEEKCREIGAGFIPISEPLKGEDNHLNVAYSSDAMVHLNQDGLDIWLGCLRDYAQEQYDLGLWDPFEPEETATPDPTEEPTATTEQDENPAAAETAGTKP